jgi:AraC-like DNA-binding protein
MSVKEVANHLGFESIHYFSRAFKKHFGHSPSGLSRRESKS